MRGFVKNRNGECYSIGHDFQSTDWLCVYFGGRMASEVPIRSPSRRPLNEPGGLTASIVSHGQMPLANTLIADLIRHEGPQLQRLVVTLNIPEGEAIRAEGASFEVVVLHNDRPLGFGANHNRAFQHCDTPWFAVLNPDLRLSSNTLGRLLAAREAKDGLLAPLILNADGTAADAARRVPTPLQIAARRLRLQGHRPDPDFDWLAGMCLVLDSQAFRSLGGFDERYFMYCEDTDLCLRLQLAGWRLRYVPSVRLMHEARRDSHRSLRYLLWHLASLARLWLSPTYRSYLRQREALRAMRQTAAPSVETARATGAQTGA
jgi:N-acetylglucosaminyl-diphospho-decaprenol L-rhamnosyltransferase